MENTNGMPRQLKLSACGSTGVIRFVRGNANAAARNSPRIVARRRKMNGRKKFYIHERERKGKREREAGRKRHRQRDASPMEQFATTKTALRKDKRREREEKAKKKEMWIGVEVVTFLRASDCTATMSEMFTHLPTGPSTGRRCGL